MNRLFLDLDECMVHSLYADDEDHADQLIDDYSEHWRGEKFELAYAGSGWDFHVSTLWYVTFLRSITRDLLTFSRQIFGNDNVFMLSTGTLDYIQTVNRVLELGFDPNTNVLGREDIIRIKTSPRFQDSFNVLVDDRSYEYHTNDEDRNKIMFLNNIPQEQFVRINKFTVWQEPLGKNDKVLEDVKENILKAFKF